MIEIEFDQNQIEQWAEEAKGQVLEFAVEVLQDVSLEIVYNTPVVTGFLRGSWYAGVGESASGEPGQNDPVATIGSILADLQIGDVYTFENGAAYAARIEYGFHGEDSLGRHYDQTPKAMVGRAVDRVQEIADAAAARVGSR